MICSRLTPGLFADGLFEKIDYNEEDEKDGISQEDVASDGQIIQAAGSQQIGHTDKDEQSGKDEDKKEEGKVKADDDAADESGVHGLEQSEKDIEDAPSDAEKPKKEKGEKSALDFLIATHNMKKRAELQRILSPLGVNVLTAMKRHRSYRC